MKNNSLAQHSNDISSTKEYSNQINTFINQNMPSSIFPSHLNKIKIKKNLSSNEYSNLSNENNDLFKKIYNNNSNSVSSNSKPAQNKIIFNSAKSFSAKPTKYFSDSQKNTKMKIIELNSNSNSNSCKENNINNSFHPSKITPIVSNTQRNNNSSKKRKINNIPMNKSTKDFFSNSQGFSCFSKSFHNKYKSNKNSKRYLSNLDNLNKSSSSLRISKKSYWKNSGRSSKSNSYRKYTHYLNPTSKQYLGIDLNLVSNSSHRKLGEYNSQKNRYLKHYNYNNDDENYKNEDEILDYDLKSNDNYFFPKRTENDEDKEDNDNENYMLTENNFDNKINNSNKYLSGEDKKSLINLNINKDISQIEPSEKSDTRNIKNNNIKKDSLNQYINKSSLDRPPFPKKNKKEEFNNSFTNIRHQDNTSSINQINPSTPVSSFQMCPYEADSSPTNYIKSISNANNITYLTNNNSRRHNHYKNKGSNSNRITKEQSEGQSFHSINKSKEDDEQQKSYSHFNLNQSEYTNNNSIYKVSEKEEEKRIYEKLENNHKLRNRNIDAKRINNRSQNTIEEKDEESEYLDKINSKLLSKEKDKKKNLLNKNSDFEVSQESNFPEAELLNDNKNLNEYINNENIKNKKCIRDIENSKISENNDIIKLDKKYEDSLLNVNDKEDLEIIERLKRLRKEEEKNEEIDKEEKILRKKLEEEKYKKKMEEERIKRLKNEEEEKKRKLIEKEEEKLNSIKKEKEQKLNELIKIKEEIKKEEEQRINLAKEAELLERKIKITDINKDNEILTSYPNIPDINSSKPNKPFLDNKLFYNYNLSLNEIKKESKNKDDLTNSLNNKENIITNKNYINNPNNSETKNINKTYHNYNYNYGANANIDNEILNPRLKLRNISNKENHLNDNLINKDEISNNILNLEDFKKIVHEKKEKMNDDNNKKINNIPYNKTFYKSNSLSQFQIEILPKENNRKKKYSLKGSFSSYTFQNNKNSNKKNIQNSSLKNDTNENSIELNNNKDDNINKNENTTYSINNNSYNNSLISQRLKEKGSKTMTKNVSTQCQENYTNKNNNKQDIDKNNNLFFKNYSTGADNTIKSEFKTSFLNYSKNNQNNNINNNNNENSNSESYIPKNNTLFEFDKFKIKYDKLNSNKKSNKSISSIDNMFNKMNTYISNKKNNDDENDDFYKKKKYIGIKMIDNKISLYSKIPHHLKNEKNKGGLWSDYSINAYNKSNNNSLGLTDQSTTFYSLNSSNKSNKYGFRRKINTSVFPANPFDSVNEAREYFFFND